MALGYVSSILGRTMNRLRTKESMFLHEAKVWFIDVRNMHNVPPNIKEITCMLPTLMLYVPLVPELHVQGSPQYYFIIMHSPGPRYISLIPGTRTACLGGKQRDWVFPVSMKYTVTSAMQQA